MTKIYAGPNGVPRVTRGIRFTLHDYQILNFKLWEEPYSS